MASRELIDLRGRTEKLRQETAEILKQAGDDYDMNKVTVIDGDSSTKVAYLKALNMELDEAMRKLEPLEVEEKALIRSREQLKKFGEPLTEHPGFQVDGHHAAWTPQPGSTLGKTFTDAWNASGRKWDREIEVDIGPNPVKATAYYDHDAQLKTLLQTGAGWAPQAIRTGQVVPYATRPIQLIDLLPGGNTNQASVVYMEETTFTPAAQETAEGTSFPEAALAFTERNVPVRKVPVFIPVTDEQLEDIDQVQGLLNQRLPFFIRQRVDGQILAGTGTAPNLVGIISGSVTGLQTQAKSTDPGPDAIYKAIVKVRVTGRANPNAVVLHPTDYQNIRLLRTADGIYIFGNPTDTGTDRIWGLPIVQCDAGSAGTAVVGDFAGFSQLVEKRGIVVKVSDSHSDFFIKGTQAIRADYRCAIVWYRGAAFCTVTGL